MEVSISLSNQMPKYTLDNADAFVGHEIGTSDWVTISQQEVFDFGQVTRDPDPNHVDPDWARAHGSYGYPIVFGFQTLAMLTFLGKQAGMKPKEVGEEFNYGFDSVRFVSPVPAGSRVRAKVILKGVRSRDEGYKVLTFRVEMEVEGSARPALVADWLVMCGPERKAS